MSLEKNLMTDHALRASEIVLALKPICTNSEIELTTTGGEAKVIVSNPSGGAPIQVFAYDYDDEYKIIFGKTPRFFPDTEKALLIC